MSFPPMPKLFLSSTSIPCYGLKNSGMQTSSIRVIKELVQLRDSTPGTIMAFLDGRRKPFMRSEVNKKYLEVSSLLWPQIGN